MEKEHKFPNNQQQGSTQLIIAMSSTIVANSDIDLAVLLKQFDATVVMLQRDVL